MDATGRYDNVINILLRLVAVLELWVDTCKSGATTVTRRAIAVLLNQELIDGSSDRLL